jgi:hypothetical protein
MTPEELRAKLEEAGIPVGGSWQETREKVVQSPLVEKKKEVLRRLEKLVEKQIEQDKERISELHGALVRLKHGGGQ